MIFFEIPIMAVILFILCIFGIKVGEACIIVGAIGLLFGALLTWDTDADRRWAGVVLFIVPPLIVVLLGLFIGDRTLYDLLFH